MKLSVSLSEDDVRVLDAYVNNWIVGSAAVQASDSHAPLSRPRRGLRQRLGRVVERRRGRHLGSTPPTVGSVMLRGEMQVDFNPAGATRGQKPACSS